MTPLYIKIFSCVNDSYMNQQDEGSTGNEVRCERYDERVTTLMIEREKICGFWKNDLLQMKTTFGYVLPRLIHPTSVGIAVIMDATKFGRIIEVKRRTHYRS